MKNLTICLLITVFGLSVGCVSQRKYDDLEQAYRKKLEQEVDLQTQLEELDQRIAMMEGQVQDRTAEIDSLQQQREALEAKRDKLARDYAGLQHDYAALIRRKRGIVVSPELDAALKEYARANPQLVEYDSALGMVKFRSDLTFALGSAELNPAARESIQGLSRILTAAEAEQYEIRIIGHTDNVPIKRAATRQRHPSNWHLSVHRAISVRDTLQSSGVPAERTSVAGYGEYRPIVPNQAIAGRPKGAEANRRVEIFLVATRALPPVPEPAEPEAEPVGAAEDVIFEGPAVAEPAAEPADMEAEADAPAFEGK